MARHLVKDEKQHNVMSASETGKSDPPVPDATRADGVVGPVRSDVPPFNPTALTRMIWPRAAPHLAAAALALIIGFWSGLHVAGPPAPAGETLMMVVDERLVALGPLNGVLQNEISTAIPADPGPAAALQRGMAVLQTFRDNQGQLCREYAALTSPERQWRGVACRDGEARWVVRLHLAASPQEEDYLGLPKVGSAQPIVEAYIAQVIDGEKLPIETEEQLIAAGWEKY